MDILIAIGHIVGSILTILMLSSFVLGLMYWKTAKNEKKVFQELSIELGVTVEELKTDDMSPGILKFLSDRFSKEQFRNRISDIFGTIVNLWGWLGQLIQLVILAGVIWYTFTDTLDVASKAWVAVAVSLFFIVTSIFFSFLCWLLTARHPGQAKLVRNSMIKAINDQEEQDTLKQTADNPINYDPDFNESDADNLPEAITGDLEVVSEVYTRLSDQPDSIRLDYNREERIAHENAGYIPVTDPRLAEVTELGHLNSRLRYVKEEDFPRWDRIITEHYGHFEVPTIEETTEGRAGETLAEAAMAGDVIRDALAKAENAQVIASEALAIAQVENLSSDMAVQKLKEAESAVAIAAVAQFSAITSAATAKEVADTMGEAECVEDAILLDNMVTEVSEIVTQAMKTLGSAAEELSL